MSPEDYAAAFKFTIEAADLLRPRSLLTDTGHIGMSSLRCREQIRRTLLKEQPSSSPSRWKAMLGTYIDEGIKPAVREAHPDWLVDVSVTATLPSGTRISGTCDWADPGEPSVTDLKSKDGLAHARKHWHTEQAYRFQRHLLYLGMIQERGFPEEGIVRNVVVDRSGKDDFPFVWQEPFSMDVIREADEYLSDVWYAIDNNEEAPRDCAGHECLTCPFFPNCRGADIVKGPITSQRLADYVNAYGEAKAQRDEAQRILDELRDKVINVDGFTDDFEISTTRVATNGSQRIIVRAR